MSPRSYGEFGCDEASLDDSHKDRATHPQRYLLTWGTPWVAPFSSGHPTSEFQYARRLTWRTGGVPAGQLARLADLLDSNDYFRTYSVHRGDGI